MSRNGVARSGSGSGSGVQSRLHGLHLRKTLMLHLASKSPRRSELLARLGLPFGVLDFDIPEHRQPAEPAEDYVRRVAREKAGAGLLKVVSVPDALVLGADTEVGAGRLTQEQALERLGFSIHGMRFDHGDGYVIVRRDAVI